jgi:molybdopterin-guanine dinucleotide biosynthesis protein A
MGRDKALLPFGPDEVLLQRVVRLVGETVPLGQIVCVAAADQALPKLPDAVQVVRDAEPHHGPLAGLAAGMAAIQRRADAIFLCGCDTPHLALGFAARMFELLADHQIAAPHDGERFHPLAAVYRTDLLPLAESMLAAGERSLVSLLNCCDTRSVPVDEVRDVDPLLASLENCNTPTDFQRALAVMFPRSVEP